MMFCFPKKYIIHIQSDWTVEEPQTEYIRTNKDLFQKYTKKQSSMAR